MGIERAFWLTGLTSGAVHNVAGLNIVCDDMGESECGGEDDEIEEGVGGDDGERHDGRASR